MNKKFNLTESQKQVAKAIVGAIRQGDLTESFSVIMGQTGMVFINKAGLQLSFKALDINIQQLQILGEEGLIHFQPGSGSMKYCTILGSIYEAVDSNFAEPEQVVPVSTLAHGIPPELNLSVDRLRKKYPEPSKTGFLIMRFTEGKPFDGIVKTIQETGEELGLSILRADQNEFHADLWGNVRTHLEACSFGIAVYERINQDEPNANVGLEVGYLMAQNKPVLLLKEKTVKALQADLMGRLYKQFDEHDPQGTIPEQLKKWLKEYGIVV